ncbi:MAG: 2'-5' RNA ligase family protein [Alphaproteobacteria bacterium]
MKSLEVVARPSFKHDEREWLAKLRAARDPDKSAPHITLVFPGSDLPAQEFTDEIKKRAKGVKKIAFKLCSAVVVSDPQVEAYHVFLVPDQGCGAITRLYSKLHAGKLAPIMRSDITYLPHVTVASADSWASAYQFATQLNAKDFSVAGEITELEVHERDNRMMRTLATIPLEKASLFG